MPKTLGTEDKFLRPAIVKFAAWLAAVGYASFDPYDIWGTKFGAFARRLYYRRGILGLPLIAPILLLETVAPWMRGFFVCKQRFATADAQLLLAFLNLHHLALPLRSGVRCSDSSSTSALSLQPSEALPLRSGERAGVRCSEFAPSSVSCLPSSSADWLSNARSLADDLLSYSIPGYSGHCWGYPFDWQNNKGLWRKNTPFITCTPYCFEAFLNLNDVTGEERYLAIAASIARFVESDLKDTPVGVDASAASYSPHDDSKVINASAYRAYVLFEVAHRLKPEFPSPPSGERAGVRGSSLLTEADCDRYLHKARKNLNFILQSQRDDGSWLYAVDNPAETFIDHFHTCFVLKNLVKINRWLGEPRVSAAIQRGYAYYRRALFQADGTPKSFAIKPRLEIVRLEMYNVAEAITLGALLKDEIPEALELARRLARRLVEEWQLSDGHFVTRVYRGGVRHTLPFLRWPQAQLFYALTKLLRANQ